MHVQDNITNCEHAKLHEHEQNNIEKCTFLLILIHEHNYNKISFMRGAHAKDQ